MNTKILYMKPEILRASECSGSTRIGKIKQTKKQKLFHNLGPRNRRKFGEK